MVPDKGCLVSIQGTPASVQPVLLGMQPLSSRSAAGMRGGSAAAPAGAPLLGRTRRPFFSRRRLQNAPLVPAVGSGGGSKCQRVGLGYRRTTHGPRAPRAGLPTQPRPPGRQKALSSPGTAKSLTWEDAQPHRRRAAAHRHTAPACSSLHPAAHGLQSACLPRAHEGRGTRRLHSCLTCCCPPRRKLGPAHPDLPHSRYQLAPELHCVPRLGQGHSD